MTATDDFFKKVMNTGGNTGGKSSGGTATDDFFKKVMGENTTSADKKIVEPPENPTTPGDLGIKIGEPVKPLISSIQDPSKPDTAYSGQGTTSMGQGVKIDQTPFKMEQQKAQAKSDEDLRIKQEDLVMGAQQMGHLFVDKLSPEDKDILISGLKNKSASLAYQGQAQKMSELVGVDINPQLKQAGPNDTIDTSLSLDPNDPANFAYYEKQKRNFDMVAPDGTKIKAYNKTAVDDPIENINVALGMGRDQVMGTIGAIGEWMGVSDGTFRKQAENSQKWGELDFNKPLDDTNASVFDSRFWTQKVPQSIPFMVALVPAGIAGAGVGGEAAAIAGLGELGTYLTTAGFAGISSRIAESITEGAGVYADLKDQGVDDSKASQEAFDTAKQNMWMVFSDMGQMAITFAPVKKIPGLQSMLGKVVIPTAKFAFDATSEGGEEVFQGYVQQLNTAQGLGKQPLSILEYLNSDEARETFKLGAATGLMFGGVGVAKDAYDNFIDRAISQVDMVDEAIQKNDIDFVPKMEVLAEKGAVSDKTVEAVKTLLDLSLQNEGTSLSEWMSNGMQARKEKIDETRGKIQDLNNSMKEKETTQKQATYRETLKQAGMSEPEIEKTLTIEKEFGLDIPQSEFINEFVAKEIGRNFTYNTDLAGKYSPQVEEAIKTAIENYKKLEGMKSDLGIEKQQGDNISTTPEIHTKDEWKDIKNKEKIIEMGDQRDMILKSRISTYEQAKALYEEKETPLAKKQMNQALKDIKEINPEYIPGYNIGSKPMDLTTTPEVSSTPEKADNSNIESIKKLSDKEIQEKYTPSEILAIEDKENPTPEETAIRDRYISAVEEQEMKKINKEIEEDYAENGQHVAISEDSDITYRDLEILAQRIAQTLNDPKIRFGLKRSKNSMDMSTKTEKYLKTSKEGTLEALTEEFQSLKNGLKEIIEYYQRTKKHPYTRQKLGELYEALTKGEYDFLESGDVFQETINPYLYEGKKQVSPKVGKTKSEGARGSSKVSDPDSGTSSEEGGKKVGTSKTGIVNALKEVDKKFQSTKLTTKILNKLGDRETVSKEFVINLTNSGDIKQVEKDIIRSLLENEGEKINVAEFKVKVESELLPLKVATKQERLAIDPNAEDYFADPNKYEFVNLPEYLRGDVKDYRENIYESPIITSAGDIHFSGQTEKYFGHTRVEDMADDKTRRIIEVQSDLYQKKKPGKHIWSDTEMVEVPDTEGRTRYLIANKEDGLVRKSSYDKEMIQTIMKGIKEYEESMIKLEQYNDPTAHFRMIREELAQAAQDNIEKVQFPTGDTAMKIEGLGSTSQFGDYELSNRIVDENPNIGMTALQQQARLTPENLEIGKKVQNGWNTMVVTEILGDGKFRAISEDTLRDIIKERNGLDIKGDLSKTTVEFAKEKIAGFRGMEEEFDISGKVDQSNPIYKFYEKEVGRYLKNNYNGKLITDDKGVSWYEVEVTDDMKNQVLAFQNQGDQSNAWIYDIIGEKYGVKPFAQEKVDMHEAYMEAIDLAPEGWKVRVEDPTPENFLENVVAYADLAKKEIVISTNEARKSTAAHESVHAALSELPEAQRKVIVETAKKQWEKETKKTLTDDQAEEFLAEEFKYFIENKKYKTKTLFGRLKEFLSKLFNTIKGIFGKGNKIKKFYEDIMAGKIVNAETRVGKKFQSIYDDIDAEAFGEKPSEGNGPKLGYRYQKGEKEKTPGKGWASFKEFSRKALVPIDSVIGSIDKGLKEKMGKFEYGVVNSEIMQEARIIMESLKEKLGKKKDSEDYRILDIALKNGDGDVVGYYAKKLGIQDELTEVRKVLDKIHEEATKVGLDIKYLEEYFPRTVNDSIGLLSYIYKTEYGSQIQNAIKLSEVEAGHDLTDEEKAVIANKMLRGYKVAGITLTPPGNVKARSIEEINKELNPFYNDSMDSLAIYIQGMNENIESRKLFGKGENLQNSIGMYILDLLQKGKITPVQEIQLTKALQSRFASPVMDAWVAGYKGIAYITTMGSPISALSQIQDLAFSLYENGFMRTGSAWIQAMTGNSVISRDDLGITSIVQEFKEPGNMQAAVTKVFKLVGLEYMDAVGKETLINGAYRNIQKQVLRGNMSELTKFDFTPEETKEILEAFKTGKVNDNIKYVLFSKLMKYQPLTRSQMPEYYNTSGNLKILYMLKSFLVKQVDVFRQEAFNEIAEGVKTKNKEQIYKGIGNLMKLTIALMFMGGLTDILKNLLLNRPFDLTDLMVDNILKLMGFSKYTVYKVKEESLSSGILSIVMPPFNFFNDVIVDIYSTQKNKDPLTNPLKAQSINNIPVAGKLYYWWFGKGADKSNKKRDTASKAGTIKVSTKKVNPFSDTNGFKSTNGFKDKTGFK